ncbi:MAG: ABC transporter permease, partial [Pseudomonadota bacterium]
MSAADEAGARRPRAEALRRFGGLLAKESIQIVRDPSTGLIAGLLPLILLFVFGYGVSLDTERLRVGLVVEQRGEAADSLAAAFEASRYLEVVRRAHDRRAVEGALVAGDVRGVIVIPAGFRPGGDQRRRTVGVLTDGSEPNTAKFVASYTEGVVAAWGAGRPGRDVAPAITLIPRMRFNPELASRYFLVPGSIAIVMTLIGTLLTALVVAREWERGTMEALMATPVGIGGLLLAKLLPYFVLALGSMALVTLLAVWGFGVPLRGSVPALLAIAVAFLFPALGQG